MRGIGFFAAAFAFVVGVAITAVVAVVGVPVSDEGRAWGAVFLVSTYLLAIRAAAGVIK
jgi:hypothetical protein